MHVDILWFGAEKEDPMRACTMHGVEELSGRHSNDERQSLFMRRRKTFGAMIVITLYVTYPSYHASSFH